MCVGVTIHVCMYLSANRSVDVKIHASVVFPFFFLAARIKAYNYIQNNYIRLVQIRSNIANYIIKQRELNAHII